MSVITATDPDHLDIYGTAEAYLESFEHYTTLIQPGGALIIRKGISLHPQVQPGVKVYTYSRDEVIFTQKTSVSETVRSLLILSDRRYASRISGWEFL